MMVWHPVPGSVAWVKRFEGSAAKRCRYKRMVLREMPVLRLISHLVAPPLSNVRMVICRCALKTFRLGPLGKTEQKVTSPVGWSPGKQCFLSCH